MGHLSYHWESGTFFFFFLIEESRKRKKGQKEALEQCDSVIEMQIMRIYWQELKSGSKDQPIICSWKKKKKKKVKKSEIWEWKF